MHTITNLGSIYLKENEPEKARECFEIVLSYAPAVAQALVGLSRYYMKKRPPDVTTALEFLSFVYCSGYHRNMAVLTDIASAFILEKAYPDALRFLDEAFAIDAEDETANRLRAYAIDQMTIEHSQVGQKANETTAMFTQGINLNG